MYPVVFTFYSTQDRKHSSVSDNFPTSNSSGRHMMLGNVQGYIVVLQSLISPCGTFYTLQKEQDRCLSQFDLKSIFL